MIITAFERHYLVGEIFTLKRDFYISAAMFFLTYEYVKCLLHTDSASHFRPVKHMLAASAGEVVSNRLHDKVFQKCKLCLLVQGIASFLKFRFLLTDR